VIHVIRYMDYGVKT